MNESIVDRVRGSYGLKFAIALLVLVAVVIGFGGLIYLQTGDQLETTIQNDLTQTTELRAAELDTWLDSVKDQSRLISDTPAMKTDNTTLIQAEFKSLINSDSVAEGVVAMHYLDTESKTLLTSSADQMVGVNTREQGAAFAENPPEFSGPNDAAITKPFEVPIVDFPVVAVISPVPETPNRAVILMINLERRMAEISSGTAGAKMVVVNDDGTYIAHPNGSNLLTSWDREGGEEILQQTASGETGFVSESDEVTAFTPLQTNDWTVLYSVPRNVAFGLQQSIGMNILILIGLTLIGVVAIGLTIGRNTVRSLEDLSSKADTMANGDLSVHLETTRSDEIGSLVQSFDEMRQSLRSRISDAKTAKAEAENAREDAEMAKEDAEAMAAHIETKATHYQTVLDDVAAGDLTCRAETDSHSEAMTAIGESLNQTISQLEESIGSAQEFAEAVGSAAENVSQHSEQVMSASDAVSTTVEDVRHDTERQAEAVGEASEELGDLSASAEEIAATAGDLADRTDRAAEAGADGREAAEAALEAMDPITDEIEDAVADIESLQDEVEAIVESTDVINEIAAETNMLALNASIEATRSKAGGQGFAVVADEVKNLAEETQQAAGRIESRTESVKASTDETVTRIRKTNDRIVNGVETVETAIRSLETIATSIEDINTGVSEIDNATDQQARSTQTTVATIDEVKDITERTETQAVTVGEAAEQQAMTLSSVEEQTRTLAQRAESLRERLDAFEVTIQTTETD